MPTPGTLHVGYVLEEIPRVSSCAVFDELASLERLGTSVTLFALSHAEGAEAVLSTAGLGIRTLPAPAMGLVGARSGGPRPPSKAAWIARRGVELGVQHWHAPSMASVAAAKRVHEITGLPFTFVVNAADLGEDPASFTRLRAAIVSSAFTVASSDSVLARVVERCGVFVARKLRCLYPGLDPERFPFAGSENRLDDAVLAVGPLSEDEGFLDLIEAIAILRERGRLARLTLVGTGPLEPQIRERVEALALTSQVTLTGAVASEWIVDLMKSHAVLALPRASDAGSGTHDATRLALEAMACGLPVVATEVSGLADVILDGVSGRVIGARHPVWMAGALETLLAVPTMRARFAAAARRDVEGRFHLHRNVASLMTWFAHAVASRGPAAARAARERQEDGRSAAPGGA